MSLSQTMMAKRAHLATEVKDVLDAHGYAAFKVEQHIRQKLLDGSAELDRDELMGDPIAYARIAHTGNEPEDAQQLSFGGQAVGQVPHQFAAFVWFQYEDARALEDASQQKWDEMLEAQGETPGLLQYLRAAGGFEVSTGNVVYVGNPEQVLVPDEPLHMAEGVYAHYCQFFITIT